VPTEVLVLALLGGLLALDGTSVGQFMLSRPMVAATFAGWIVGTPVEAFMVGVVLELYLLVSFPVGGSRFPEGGPAAVVAAAVAAASDQPGGLAIGVGMGLLWGQVGGYTVTALRTVNARLAPDPARSQVTRGGVVGGHLAAVVLDFLRGFLVTVVGLLVGDVLIRLAPLWPLTEANTRGLLLVGGAVSLGILLRSYGGIRRRGILFAVGLSAGALGGYLL
jgi:mannose/fructose/N-acetylgalactosamine-specific phosphotransferase system component IIC